MVKDVLVFALTILLALIILPNLSFYFRPNIILIFLIFLFFKRKLFYNLSFWLIGGLILDSLRSYYFGVSSILFCCFLILGYILSFFFDFQTKISQLVVGSLFILLYYLAFIFVYLFYDSIFLWSFLSNMFFTWILFVLIFILKSRFNHNQNVSII